MACNHNNLNLYLFKKYYEKMGYNLNVVVINFVVYEFFEPKILFNLRIKELCFELCKQEILNNTIFTVIMFKRNFKSLW